MSGRVAHAQAERGQPCSAYYFSLAPLYLSAAMAAEAPNSPPSLENIISRHGLTSDDLESVCPRDVRHNIAVKLVDWKMVGHSFSFPKEKIAAIERENDTEDLRKVALLDAWNEREGKGASYLKLAGVLHQRERNDLVELLCDRILQKRASSVSDGGAQNEKGMLLLKCQMLASGMPVGCRTLNSIMRDVST